MSLPPTDAAPEAAAVREPTGQVTGPRGRRRPDWLSASSIVLGVLIFAAWIFLATAHADDRYRLDHVSGARVALARYVDDGVLYPELYDGHRYGGTRFMPLPIVLHGLVAQLTGEYLVSGRLLAYAATLGLLATMFVALKRLRCPFALQILLPALVLTTATGLSASINMRADVLPLLLQLLAVSIVSSSERTSGAVAAGVLAALALFTKTTALWAPLAIVAWLLFRDRRRLAWFIGTYAGSSAALLLAFVAVTHGRIVENVFGLATSGVGARSILLAPYRFLHLIVADATTAWAILPIAGVAVWLAVKERRSSIYVLSLPLALAVLLVVLTDVGTGWNQLIDVVVLAAIVTGELAGRIQADVSADRPGSRVAAVIVGITLLWITASGAVVTIVPELEGTVNGNLASSRVPLEGIADRGTAILSEDAYVHVSLGQLPVVLDPFMLLRLGRERPEAVRDLIDRIEAQEFELVVLVNALEPLDQAWWSEQHFGPDVVEAIDRAYRFAGRLEGYYLYEPREAVIEP